MMSSREVTIKIIGDHDENIPLLDHTDSLPASPKNPKTIYLMKEIPTSPIEILNPRSPQRGPSLNQDLQDKLMEAMKRDDLSTFHSLLQVTIIEQDTTASEFLATACWCDHGGRYVSAILNAGVSPNAVVPSNIIENTFPRVRKIFTKKKAQVFQNDHWCGRKRPLHLASGAGNFDVIKALMDDPRTEINAKDSILNTALHYLASHRYAGTWSPESFERCADLLLDKDNLEIDAQNSKKRTALHQCAESDNFLVLKKILVKSRADVNLVDENQNTVLHLLSGNHEIAQENTDSFESCVRFLVTKKEQLDINKTNKHGSTALHLAAEFGNHEVLLALLKDHKTNVMYLDNDKYTPLHRLALNNTMDKSVLEKCIRQYLNRKEVDVNITGASNRTPLLVSARSGNYTMVKALLKDDNTNVGAKDKIGRSILHYIVSKPCQHKDPGKTKEIMDLVLTIPQTKGNSKIYIDSKDNFGYTPLHMAVMSESEEMVKFLLSRGASIIEENNKGTTILDDIEPKTLETFMDESVTQINKFHDRDCKLIYDYQLLFVDVCEHRKKIIDNEIEVIHCLSKNAHLKELLVHPLITSFLYLKWRRLRYLLFGNVAFYTLFVLLLNWYIVSGTGFWGNLYQKKGDDNLQVTQGDPNNTSLFILWFFTFLLTILLLLKEMYQLLLSPRKYMFGFENVIELILTLFTCFLLFGGCSRESECRQSSVIATILSWLMLILVTGSLPMFSIKLEMLKTVLRTFLRYISWYFIMILGFSFSFYILFYSGRGSSEDSFFNPLLSVERTVVMLTGEFDSTGLPFGTVPITSHIVFIMFVILITIVLLNLLNGLAVSDTQEIQRKAKLLSMVSRAKFIYNTENMLLDGKNSKPVTGDKGFIARLQRLHGKFVDYLCTQIRVFPKVNNLQSLYGVTMPNRMVHTKLKSEIMSIVKKEKKWKELFTKEKLSTTIKSHICKVHEMELSIIKATKKLINEKKIKAQKNRKNAEQKDCFECIENKMQHNYEALLRKINDYDSKFNNLEKNVNNILTLLANKVVMSTKLKAHNYV